MRKFFTFLTLVTLLGSVFPAFSQCDKTINIIATDDSTCAGVEETLYTYDFLNGQYQWYKDGELLEGETSRELIARTPGVYYLQADSANCSSTSNEITIQEFDKPVFHLQDLDVCYGTDANTHFRIEGANSVAATTNGKGEVSTSSDRNGFNLYYNNANDTGQVKIYLETPAVGNCPVSKDSFNINFGPTPFTVSLGEDYETCQSSYYQLEAKFSGEHQGDFLYQFSVNGNLYRERSHRTNQPFSGKYSVFQSIYSQADLPLTIVVRGLDESSGCEYSDTLLITESENSNNMKAKVLLEGDPCTGTVSLTASGSGNREIEYFYWWEMDDLGYDTLGRPYRSYLKHDYTFDQDDLVRGYTNIVLKVIDEGNCFAQDTVRVNINTEECGNWGLVKGYVFDDLNQNGILDNDENGIARRVVKAGSDVFAITDSAGEYSLVLPEAEYEMQTSVFGNWDVTTQPHPVLHTVNGDTTEINLGTYLNPVHDLRVSLSSGAARPGFKMNYYVYLGNSGNYTESGQLTLTPDERLEFISAEGSPVLNNGEVVWNFEDLQADSSLRYLVTVRIPVDTELGEELHHSLSVNYDEVDATPENNDDSFGQVVRGSFDPNDKLVKPEGLYSDHFVRSDDSFDYTIRFQNTGTDTAFTVVVRDTLDSDLDFSTFQMVATSHNYSLEYDYKSRLLTWRFENILLPDSNTNEPLSHGYIRYEIDQKEGNTDGTEITNQAGIYFDYNAPVITNETRNTVNDAVITSVTDKKELKFNVYPNPAHSEITINSREEFSGYTISELSGRVVKKGAYSSTINVRDLNKGVYLLILESEDNSSVEKLIIN